MLTQEEAGGNAYNTVKDSFSEGYNKNVLRLSEQLDAPWPEGITFYVVAALINLEQDARARQLISSALPQLQKSEQADLIALDGLLDARRGDSNAYRNKAVSATNLQATPNTLYHLGITAVELEESLRVLQAAMLAAEEADDTYAEARNAHALAITHMNLGNFKEALGWVQFCHARTKHYGIRMVATNTRAFLQLLIGKTEKLEESLIDAVYEIEHRSSYTRQKTQLRTTLADLYQATGRYEEALDIYDFELQHAPRVMWSWLTHGCVRALCALNVADKAQERAETTIVVTETLSEYHRQRAHLALAIALWPSAKSIPLLTSAYHYFKNSDSILATEAAFHLFTTQLNDVTTVQEVRATAKNAELSLTTLGTRLLSGQSLSTLQEKWGAAHPLRLFTLGKAEVHLAGKLVNIRKRSLELLIILISRPSGYEPEALSEALYGRDHQTALRVELHRLRKELNITISSRPYRLTSPLWADLLELETSLKQGDLNAALKLYRGPLLPSSMSPYITDLRRWLETELHAAVLATYNVELVWELAQIMSFDIELWEFLANRLPHEDPRYSIVIGRSTRVRLELDF